MRTCVFVILAAISWLFFACPLDAAIDRSHQDEFNQPGFESRESRVDRSARKVKTLESVWLYDEEPEARQMVDADDEFSVYAAPILRKNEDALRVYGRDYARVANPELADMPLTLADTMIKSVRNDTLRKKYRDKFDALGASGKGTADSYYALYAEIVRDETLRKWESNKEYREKQVTQVENARVTAQREVKKQSRWQALRKTLITGLLVLSVTSLALFRRHTWLQIGRRIGNMAGRISKSVPKTTAALALLTLIVATAIPAATGHQYFEKCLGFGAIVAGCLVPFFLLLRCAHSPLKRAFAAYRKDDPGKALAYFSFVVLIGFSSYLLIEWLVRELGLP